MATSDQTPKLTPGETTGTASETRTGEITSSQAQSTPQQPEPKTRPICRFFNTPKGCRAGDACPFLHEPSIDAKSAAAPTDERQNYGKNRGTADTSRTVQRPTPQKEIQDPRAFQISQMQRRFSPRTEELENGDTSLHFSMSPSDPDFPFEIDSLECTLLIPKTFPSTKLPRLRVTNKSLERGYQINVEQGFEAIWIHAQKPTLLNAFNTLDKRLETLLTAQKAETIKLLANTRPTGLVPADSLTGGSGQIDVPIHSKKAPPPEPMSAPTPIKPSAEQIEKARSRREAEIQQLEHRLSRDPQFRKISEETFTIPVDPRKRNDLDPSIQAVKTVSLFVPLSYDLEPSTIRLLGVEGEAAEAVADSFERRNREKPEVSLLSQINYVAQNMHTMSAPVQDTPRPVVTIAPAEETETEETLPPADSEKSHIHIIPRPPEWAHPREEDEEGGSGSSEDDFEDSAENEDDDVLDTEEGQEQNDQPQTSAPREKGILISFPHLELHGIELMELATVSITIRCLRCKDTMDVTNIKDNEKGDYTGLRSESCKKCALAFSIGFRKDLLHANSIRAGYLDLDGCTVVDLLPSNFTPTCSECSTTYPANPGVMSVRGDSTLAICRNCHRKMVFRIPEVKFLHVGEAAAVRAARGLPLKKKKENLGIVAGQELPKRGRCIHYRRSMRWFRFSCCNKVFACDKCHDLESDHPQEFANRMICGFCSREQNYKPEHCGICQSILTGRSTSGFWEGGKGTRDRARMSRKDPRKYKRRGGGASSAK